MVELKISDWAIGRVGGWGKNEEKCKERKNVDEGHLLKLEMNQLSPLTILPAQPRLTFFVEAKDPDLFNCDLPSHDRNSNKK